MVLTAVAVIFMTTEKSKQQTSEALTNNYTVLRNNGNESDAALVGESLVNALVIVAVITIMTFVIVILYKYRCMKVLIGYMIVAMLLLLLTLSARMFDIAVQRYQFTMDYLTFCLLIYNFAAVGTVAIFFAQGVPKYVTQSYLVLTSVFVAWELSHFDEFTAWALLALLALYDLYAVLTPYGPLQALVKLMQSPDAPPMPGLLYEAHVGGNNNSNNAANNNNNDNDNVRQRRQSRRQSRRILAGGNGSSTNSIEHQSENESGTSQTDRGPEDFASPPAAILSTPKRSDPKCEESVPPLEPPTEDTIVHSMEHKEAGPVDVDQWIGTDDDDQEAPSTEATLARGPLGVEQVTQTENQQFTEGHGTVLRLDQSCPRLSIPLALAKLYRLPLENDPQPPWLQPRTANDPAPSYSVEVLVSIVVAIAPHNGGIIRPHPEQIHDHETRYQVLDPSGQARRVLFVNSSNGRVFEVHNYEELLEKRNKTQNKRETIRLGLGDFIFYSVLVSKAALFSWTTFCAATLAITCGLGLTLLLLAWHAKALPALPISIFLGVTFYLTTRHLLQPWVEEVFKEAIYV